MRGRFIIIVVALAVTAPTLLKAQRISISTNLADYANFATFNIEGAYALNQHWSVFAKGAYNPFTFNKGTAGQIQHRLFSISAGSRYWFWHFNSGWFAGAKLQYSIYNYGGLVSRRTEEGMGYSVGLFGGYAIMLTPNLNLELGIGLLGGIKDYVRYKCQNCGEIVSKGVTPYIFPDNFIVQLVYMF